MKQNSIFIVLEKDSYEESPTIVCVCSTEEKAKKALNMMKEKNKEHNHLLYYYEEANLDCISIYL